VTRRGNASRIGIDHKLHLLLNELVFDRFVGTGLA
jgi:hypothetical protein